MSPFLNGTWCLLTIMCHLSRGPCLSRRQLACTAWNAFGSAVPPTWLSWAVGPSGCLRPSGRRFMEQDGFVFDIDDDRLALGRKLGVEHTFNTMSPGFKEQAVAATAGRGFGHAETAGVDITMKLAFELAGTKPRFVLSVLPPKNWSLIPSCSNR